MKKPDNRLIGVFNGISGVMNLMMKYDAGRGVRTLPAPGESVEKPLWGFSTETLRPLHAPFGHTAPAEKCFFAQQSRTKKQI